MLPALRTLALAVPIILAACAQPANAPNGEPTPTASVDIADFKFAPAALTVTTGTRVTWTNEDAASHTVTSDDGHFDSGVMTHTETFSHTFDQPGVHDYHCSVHPTMTATVTVTAD